MRSNNSVNITIRDESTNAIVLQNVTIVFALNGTSSEYTYQTSTGSVQAINLPVGYYTVSLSSPSPMAYTVKSYTLTVGSRSAQNLNAFLNTGGAVLFNLLDSTNSETIEGVSLTMYRIINSTWTIVESKNSDISGIVQFTFLPSTQYQFYATKSGYTSKTFTLNPILFASYNVYMTRTNTLPDNFNDVTIFFTPKIFQADGTKFNTFQWRIISSQGVLVNYGFNFTIPCIQLPLFTQRQWDFAGSNAIGETTNISFSLSCANYNDTIRIHQWYTTSSGDYVNATFIYAVSTDGGNNYTFNNMRNNNYGLGDFERIILVVLITIIFAGVSTMLGGELLGIAVGVLIMGFFIWMGLITFWMVGLPIVVGVILLIMRGSNNG
jgi:hypothetical protein